MVNDDIETLTEHFISNRQKIHEISKEVVTKCVLSFKNGKASDELDLTVEHLKHGGESVICILIKIVNMVLSNTAIPDSLNGRKPKDDPNSYRRITVTSTIGKVIEKLHLQMNQKSICKQQSCFQKGFTEGESPVIAGLVLTELNIEARETHIPLYIALTDGKRAFDVVWHEGLTV